MSPLTLQVKGEGEIGCNSFYLEGGMRQALGFNFSAGLHSANPNHSVLPVYTERTFPPSNSFFSTSK